MSVILAVIYVALWVFLGLLLARLVFDYVQLFARSWRPSGVLIVFLEIIYTVTDPPLKAIRRVLPPLRLGNVMLDLGFWVLSVAVYIVIQVVGSNL
jgi:YggT family protein